MVLRKNTLICPVCNSTDITESVCDSIEKEIYNNLEICNSCGAKGIFFPEPDKDSLKAACK